MEHTLIWLAVGLLWFALIKRHAPPSHGYWFSAILTVLIWPVSMFLNCNPERN